MSDTSPSSSRDQRIYAVLTKNLNPHSLIISNQSSKHRHHSGDDGSGETHYDITIISDAFVNISKLNRHRLVTDLLMNELNSGLHAVSLNLKTPQEV